MSSQRIGVLVLGLAAVASPGGSETTFCTKITAVPYTITKSGSYCFDRNLATAATATTHAITINADFVSLDLNGFKLDGTAGPPGTRSGVYASNRRNVTVRNGLIRGFERGVYLADAGASQDHVVEQLSVERSSRAGIWLEGVSSVVRGCRVSDTAGIAGDADGYGIRLLGAEARVLGNDVLDIAGVGMGVGISIFLEGGTGSVVEANRVGNSSFLMGSTGIRLLGGQDLLVVGNTLTSLEHGLVFEGETFGKYRDNLTSGVVQPFEGGTDAGNNQ
jgi:hypothetical protein